MRRILALSLLVLLLLNLAALIINMVSDNVEAWFVLQFGDQYLHVLTILFVVILLTTVFLTDWKKLFGQSSTVAASGNPADTVAPVLVPASAPITVQTTEPLSQESYSMLLDLYQKGETPALLNAMLQEPALSQRANILLPRYNALMRKKAFGTLDTKEEQLETNSIYESALHTLESNRIIRTGY